MAHGTPKCKTILVVDDEEDFSELLSGLLKERGYQVVVAADRDKALHVLQECPTDLVTLDVMLPDKAGMRLFRDLRTDANWRSIPVVIVTGLATAGDEIRELIYHKRVPPPEGYLEKPIDRNALFATLHCILGE